MVSGAALLSAHTVHTTTHVSLSHTCIALSEYVKIETLVLAVLLEESLEEYVHVLCHLCLSLHPRV